MAIFSRRDRQIAEALAGIAFGNPFGTGRIALERQALGADFVETGPVIVWSGASYEAMFPNVPALHRHARRLADDARQRLRSGHDATEADLRLYEDLVFYVLYNRHMSLVHEPIRRSLDSPGWEGSVKPWPEYRSDFESFFAISSRSLPSQHRPEHLFAVGFQVARAFHAIFENIVGSSTATARLRAAVWQSIFTHDMRRYMRTLHRTMADVPTLIVGPSGTGKELVARAIGLSCYIPFVPGTGRSGTGRFKIGGAEMYTPLNPSALAPALIESELFGHKQGSFTGAHEDRKGWLEQCKEYGAVFLDEIGELDAAIQVKLLRVLESRQFQKVGDTETLTFKGKIIAATNRDLAVEMGAGRFRRDLYYRLCADQVLTPSLAEQLADRPGDLPELVRFIARKVLVKPTDDPDGLAFVRAPDNDLTEEVERLTAEVVTWIDGKLGHNYAWPGNFRELGQCVRNIMIRGSYRPPWSPRDGVGGLGPVEELLRHAREVRLTADELLGRYYALAYSRFGESWKAAGRTLGVDWRTVRDRHDPAFLEKLRRARAAEER
jgi:DNA-binding NtrC family response regulator